MDTNTPPPAFVAALRRFDPSLRVSWARHQACWFIAKKMAPRHRQYLAERPTSWRGPRGLDLWESWKDGYVHVLSVPVDQVNDPAVFDVLADSDAWRVGGMEGINRQLDALDEAKERAAEKKVDDWAQDATRESYERLMWLNGHRQRVPDDLDSHDATPTPEPVVEHHDGFTVRIARHRLVEETPDA